MRDNDKINCESCGYSASKSVFLKSCGNCFACTGCEIYICPECSGETIMKPIDKSRSFRKLKK